MWSNEAFTTSLKLLSPEKLLALLLPVLGANQPQTVFFHHSINVQSWAGGVGVGADGSVCQLLSLLLMLPPPHPLLIPTTLQVSETSRHILHMCPQWKNTFCCWSSNQFVLVEAKTSPGAALPTSPPTARHKQLRVCVSVSACVSVCAGMCVKLPCGQQHDVNATTERHVFLSTEQRQAAAVSGCCSNPYWENDQRILRCFTKLKEFTYKNQHIYMTNAELTAPQSSSMRAGRIFKSFT